MSENEMDPIVEKWWVRWGETGVLRHRDVIAQIVAESRAAFARSSAQRTEDLQVMLHTCESERDDLRAKLAGLYKERDEAAGVLGRRGFEIDELRAKLATVEVDTRKRVAEECAAACVMVSLNVACTGAIVPNSVRMRALCRDACLALATPPAPAEPQGPPYPFGLNAKGEQCRDWRWSRSSDPCWVRTVSGSGEHWLPDDAKHCEVCGAPRVSKEEK